MCSTQQSTLAATTRAERAALAPAEDQPLPPTLVWGIGGGSALDHAKFTAWTLGLPLLLAPSVLSVDAGFTVAAGVREDGGTKVRWSHRRTRPCATLLGSVG